jgi:hypothetical protein
MMHFEYRNNKRVMIVEVLRDVDTKEVLEVDMGAVSTEDMEKWEENPQLVLIVEKSVMYQGFIPNQT